MKTRDLRFALPLGMISGVDPGEYFRGTFGLTVGTATATRQEVKGQTFQYIKVGDVLASAVLSPLVASKAYLGGEWQSIEAPMNVGHMAVRNSPSDKLTFARRYNRVELADMRIAQAIESDTTRIPLSPSFSMLTGVAMLSTVLRSYEQNMDFTIAHTYSPRALDAIENLILDASAKKTYVRLQLGRILNAAENAFAEQGKTLTLKKTNKIHRPPTIFTKIVDFLESTNEWE